MNDDQHYRFLLYAEQNYSFEILRPLQALARSHGHEVKWLLVGNAISSDYLHEGEQQLASVRDAIIYDPHAVFVPGDRVPSFIPGLKVEVFHGLNERKRGNEYPERGMFDLYCTEGPERTTTLSALAAQRGYFKVVETGWLKLDSLFADAPDQTRIKEEGRRPQIAFASTFSPALSCAELVFDEIRQLSQHPRWQWLVTLHPKMDSQLQDRYRALAGDNLEFVESDAVIPLLHRADVMVCDNSSIFQEFLLLKKPVVTVNNRDPQAAFINIREPSQLKAAIEQALSPSDELTRAINDYGPAITPYRDGKSADRVLRAVVAMLKSDWQDRKPMNLFRNLKMRKKLGYWSSLVNSNR